MESFCFWWLFLPHLSFPINFFSTMFMFYSHCGTCWQAPWDFSAQLYFIQLTDSLCNCTRFKLACIYQIKRSVKFTVSCESNICFLKHTWKFHKDIEHFVNSSLPPAIFSQSYPILGSRPPAICGPHIQPSSKWKVSGSIGSWNVPPACSTEHLVLCPL